MGKKEMECCSSEGWPCISRALLPFAKGIIMAEMLVPTTRSVDLVGHGTTSFGARYLGLVISLSVFFPWGGFIYL